MIVRIVLRADCFTWSEYVYKYIGIESDPERTKNSNREIEDR